MKATCLTTRFPALLISDLMYLYVRVDTWDRNSSCFDKKNKTSTRRRETTRTRPRPPPAESGESSKVRHDEQTAYRMVDLISSWAVYGSKPGLNLKSRHGRHICTYGYTRTLIPFFRREEPNRFRSQALCVRTSDFPQRRTRGNSVKTVSLLPFVFPLV